MGLTTLSKTISDIGGNLGINAKGNPNQFETLCKLLVLVDPSKLEINDIGIRTTALERLATVFTSETDFTAGLKEVNFRLRFRF